MVRASQVHVGTMFPWAQPHQRVACADRGQADWGLDVSLLVDGRLCKTHMKERSQHRSHVLSQPGPVGEEGHFLLSTPHGGRRGFLGPSKLCKADWHICCSRPLQPWAVVSMCKLIPSSSPLCRRFCCRHSSTAVCVHSREVDVCSRLATAGRRTLPVPHLSAPRHIQT